MMLSTKHTKAAPALSLLLLTFATVQFAAMIMLAKPMWKAQKRPLVISESSGKVTKNSYAFTLKGSATVDLVKAFTVLFWIALGLGVALAISSAAGKSPHHKAAFGMTTVYLGLAIVSFVGVGYLTKKLWQAPTAKDGSVTMAFTEAEMVVLKITNILLLVSYGMPLLTFAAHLTK